MSTENGLDHLKHLRGHIGVLSDRHDYLLDKIDSKKAAGKETGFEEREVEALDWVLDVAEAEWDNCARLRRNLEPIENRLGALERRGVFDDRQKAPEWETRPGKYDPRMSDVEVRDGLL